MTSTDWSSCPTLTMAAAAMAAAFHDATGKPARRIPLRPEHVKAMLTVA